MFTESKPHSRGHRSGRAWVRIPNSTRLTADTCNKKLLDKKIPKKMKNVHKFPQKKLKKHFVWLPSSLPSLNCKAYKFSQQNIEIWQKKICQKIFGGTLCCALRNLTEKSLFKKHSGLPRLLWTKTKQFSLNFFFSNKVIKFEIHFQISGSTKHLNYSQKFVKIVFKSLLLPNLFYTNIKQIQIWW